MPDSRYHLDLRPRAARALAGPPRGLPERVAVAAPEFIFGPLLDSPRRVGKPLYGRHEGQHSARCGWQHRIRYRIDERARTVVVLDISRRADTYGID